MSWFPQPRLIESTVFTTLPEVFRAPRVSGWSLANKRGAALHSFLEGPCFDPAGNLYVTDIPGGRIFRISPQGDWTCLVEYDGEPNGLAYHAEHGLIVADYKNGLMQLDLATGRVSPLLERRNAERFKGVNDLIVSRSGDIYFTDQGQTGLHDPTGRVYRLRPSGQLDCLLSNGPSPNGLVLSADEDVLFVAMTRDNAIWRMPLLPDGSVGKVGRFASFHGVSGPDGVVMDRRGNLLIAHASLRAVLVVGTQGEPLAKIMSAAGGTVTNLTFSHSEPNRLFITESESGSILTALWEEERLPVQHR